MIKLTLTVKIFLISLVISAGLISLGIITADPGVLGNMIMLSTFILLSPMLLIRYKKYRGLKEMEEKYPTFLRNLIESLRAGLSFPKSIVAAGKIQYGPLSNEIKKMVNQISWGVPLDKILEQFAERIKSSKKMYFSTKIIKESYLSGGDVVSTMESVAESQSLLIDAEKERGSLLNQYVVLMYVIAFIFILIVVSLNKLMIPIFASSQQVEEFGMVNPCNVCTGTECSICGLFRATSRGLFIEDPTSIGAYYTSLFFFMAIIQAIFSGMIAGEISESSIIAGLRHSLILASIVFGTFSIFVKIGLLGV